MLVSVEHLSKMQNVRAIVDDVSFAIEEKDRIALVGVNGTGKSTLLRVIAGKEKADSGTITYRRELRISMLDQDPVFDARSTVLDAVLAGADDVSAYEARSDMGATAVSSYTVRPGDTLWSYASRITPAYGDVWETVAVLEELNDLPSSELSVGQRLIVPVR